MTHFGNFALQIWYSYATSLIGFANSLERFFRSLDNIKHQPQGGQNKIFNQKLKYNGVKSRIGLVKITCKISNNRNQ